MTNTAPSPGKPAAPDFDRLKEWVERLAPVVQAAGRRTLEIRDGGLEVETKADASPVTVADRASEAIILAELERLEPRFPIVAEEQCAEFGPPVFEGDDFWLVDALDGTKEFIRRGDDFTVNVGFVIAGVPALGLVHVPARRETFVGVIAGGRRLAERRFQGVTESIAVRPRPSRVIVAGSRSHEVPEKMDPFLANFDVAEKISVGSSLKFCLVATGKADLYPRFGPTSEWDTAAAHAVVRAAGGRVHTFDGAELRYHKERFLNGHFLVDNGA